VNQREFNLDAQTMADTLIGARDLIGSDGIHVSRDNWVYNQALGGAMVFPENDEAYSSERLLSSISDYTKLAVPRPESAPGMETVLSAARRVVDRVGDRYYIQANIDTGPFSLAAVLRGTQEFLLDVMTEPETLVHEYLNFCSEVVAAYGKAMIATGVHGIQFGDATTSLLGPE
jgi:uroporphyrinogen decarboxylase